VLERHRIRLPLKFVDDARRVAPMVTQQGLNFVNWHARQVPFRADANGPNLTFTALSQTTRTKPPVDQPTD
jgi:hypothetical protein